jgi:hypothetical protein
MSQKPIDTELTTYPICPYCGFQDKDNWELPFDGLEDTITFECKRCEMEHEIERKVTIYFTTSKLSNNEQTPQT